jgi:hypothetical protein
MIDKVAKAHVMAQKFISLKNKKCQHCRSKIGLIRHHDDYDKPLEVTILCNKCHGKLHAKFGSKHRRESTTKAFLIKKFPTKLHRRLGIESKKTGKHMELIIIEALKEKLNK